MAQLEAVDVLRTVGNSERGNRELDVFVEMIMRPNDKYILSDGNYYRHRITKNRNLAKIAPSYTTSVDDAMSLMKKGWKYDFRVNEKWAEASIFTNNGSYGCKAPVLPLAIVYLILKIAVKEGYNLQNKEPMPSAFAQFFTNEEFTEQIRKERLKRKKSGKEHYENIKARYAERNGLKLKRVKTY